jgi:hypothetical protein
LIWLHPKNRISPDYIKRRKRWTEIKNLSLRSPLSVRQNIRLKVLTMNLAAILLNVDRVLVGQHDAFREFCYEVRDCNTLSAMKDNPVRLLLDDSDQPCRLM